MSDRNSRAARPGRSHKGGKYLRRNPARRPWRIAFCVFFVIFVISGVLLGYQLYRSWQEEQALNDLSDLIETKPVETRMPEDMVPTEVTEPPEPLYDPETGILMKYKALYDMNPDFFGWISIADTQLSYPVMYTPENPEYYIHRAFDKTYSYSGVPFLSGDYAEDCGNTIIYGHNMKNGTMFRTLMSYKEEAFYLEHPVISFDTLYEEGEYEVISAFYSRVFEVDAVGVFRFYYYSDLTDPYVFEEYVTNVKELSIYDTGKTASYGDELITLITCGGAFEEQRFVVVARKTVE